MNRPPDGRARLQNRWTRRRGVPGPLAVRSRCRPSPKQRPPYPKGSRSPPRPVSPKRRLRKALRIALLLVAIATVVKEIRVAVSASRMADRVPMQELDTLPEAWSQYQALSQRSLGIGTVSLERSLVAQTLTLTDRVIAKYRVGVSTVWEPEWRMARDALARAVAVAPGQDDSPGIASLL